MAIKYPWILAILAALTIYLGYLFYKSPSVLGFIFMFLPLIAYLLILKLYDEVEPNLAKILDDAARSDWEGERRSRCGTRSWSTPGFRRRSTPSS